MIYILYQRIFNEYLHLQQQIHDVQEKLKTFPDGKLICARGNNCFKWYKSDGHNKVYIPKKERVLAEQLAAKKYLSLLLEDLEHEKMALEFYLKHHFPQSGKAEHLLTEHPGYRELLTTHFKPKSKELSDWMNSPYEQNMGHPEHLIHKTSSGIFVRSKSEAIISLFLHTNQIPFRYECALHLGTTTLYPDFTIRHPITGKTYYWEHFGRMDNPSYSQNACSKLNLYTSHGIIPSLHLITTYETKEHPLSYEDVEKIINHYFL